MGEISPAETLGNGIEISRMRSENAVGEIQERRHDSRGNMGCRMCLDAFVGVMGGR